MPFPTRLFPPLPSNAAAAGGSGCWFVVRWLRPLAWPRAKAEAVAVVLALAVTVVLDVAVAVTVAIAVILVVGRDPSPSRQCSSRRGCRAVFFRDRGVPGHGCQGEFFFIVVFFYPTLLTLNPLAAAKVSSTLQS